MPVPAAILDAVLIHLAPLFLKAANNDPVVAREAAHQLLLAYHTDTEAELTLAAEIVGFSFHALDALGQSAEPDLSLTRQIRLRGSAVSLSREAHKARRKLAQLQNPARSQKPAELRKSGCTAQPDEARQQPPLSQTEPQPEPGRPMITRQAGQSWTQAYRQHRRDRRLAEISSTRQAEVLHPHPHPAFAAP